MVARLVLAAALIAGAGLYARGSTEPERVPDRVPLAAAPLVFAQYTGADAAPFADDIVEQLGVDDYIHRRYAAGGEPPVFVYIGYYASQRQGDTIHSPRNCLPGAGWQPVFADQSTVAAGGQPVPVNRFVIQKGRDRQAVYYWYQGRGRSVASEFANKGFLMLDAARLRRTDGGLVRLMTPIASTPDAAFASLTAFTAALLPHLAAHLP